MVFFSPIWKSMLGYSEREIQDNFAEWESRLHPDDRERALATVRHYLSGQQNEYGLECVNTWGPVAPRMMSP